MVRSFTIATFCKVAFLKRLDLMNDILVQGYGVTCMRTIGLMTSYFIMVDSIRRHFPDQFNTPLLGPFLTSGRQVCIP